MKFIAENGERWGVEPICQVLPFAPTTYYAASSRPTSARELRDRELKPQIQRVWGENFRVYGADKVWAQLRREGFLVARCTVVRLMRDLGLRGVVRGDTPRTTVGAEGAERPADPVQRHFVAPAPNRLRVEAGDVRALIDSGVLPARRLGQEWRLSRVAVLNWLRSDGSTEEQQG
ncbi:MAG: IS3 family transposase [Candidatus Dormiibacterota bacterium]